MKYKYSIKQLQRMERCRWLTDRERRVFNLYFRRGWTTDDIAAEMYLSPAAVRALNVLDEAGNVDIDRIYSHVRAEAQKGSVTFSVPMIGAVTLNERDVEKLYTCIVQS